MKVSEYLVNRRVVVFAVATFFFIAFLGYFRSHFMQIDWILRIQQGITPGQVIFWRIMSSSVTVLSFGVPILLALWHWFNRSGSWLPLLYTFGSIASAGIINYIIKFIFQAERPFHTSLSVLKLGSGGSFSFPSGHSAEAFAAAVFIGCWVNHSILRSMLIVWALLVAMSRVILGVHTPADVIAGMALGSAVSLIFHQVAKANNVLE